MELELMRLLECKQVISTLAGVLARGTVGEVSWEMNARSYTWDRNTPCRSGDNISSPGEWGDPTSNQILAGLPGPAWPDSSPLLLLIGMPLEHCIQFGTLVEAQENWRELRELCWVSSWAGDTRGEVGNP
uniref:Uncharacterized protein n=1 Tax=Corvus moneduloides TaxID=1196302 RepID=A0A8C3ESB0_CORMO